MGTHISIGACECIKKVVGLISVKGEITPQKYE